MTCIVKLVGVRERSPLADKASYIPKAERRSKNATNQNKNKNKNNNLKHLDRHTTIGVSGQRMCCVKFLTGLASVNFTLVEALSCTCLIMTD